ncbi:DNA-binding response regulator [Reichenbachiella sp. 5M10]|uniref:LytR/AlgR family response regulator transcription factor n=1 Tax=Reichenbachiella sp. 5M10 TaxID=1889772 RepID=UPI000C156155|nr:LytTR family DNA-binding domain-containing protein [Reichenbachiella sp. 5M10]PIB36902.1 DNA-binding response regulator [Reichenbachiella sp. 5M10]
MKVLIIEDEAPAFRRLQKLLTEIDPTIEIVEVLDGVSDTIEWLHTYESPDLIFMDIQLNDGISFEIFDQIEVKKPVIFTTAFDDYMLKAFRVNSIDYLLKPIKQSELQRSLEKYQTLKTQLSDSQPKLQELVKNIQLVQAKYKSRFLVKMGEKMMSVETDNIACFQACHGLVHLITHSGKKYLIDLTLDEISKQLNPEKFYRVNRQYILCYHCIAAVHKYGKSQLLIEPKLTLDDQVIVSSEKSTAFKQWLG